MFPLADTAREKGPAAITKLLIAVNVAVFGWQIWLALAQGGGALAGFVNEHALVAARIVKHPLSGEPWQTVLTHMFLHGGVLHLLGHDHLSAGEAMLMERAESRILHRIGVPNPWRTRWAA